VFLVCLLCRARAPSGALLDLDSQIISAGIYAPVCSSYGLRYRVRRESSKRLSSQGWRRVVIVFGFVDEALSWRSVTATVEASPIRSCAAVKGRSQSQIRSPIGTLFVKLLLLIS
jgi:hypothetical protein